MTEQDASNYRITKGSISGALVQLQRVNKELNSPEMLVMNRYSMLAPNHVTVKLTIGR